MKVVEVAGDVRTRAQFGCPAPAYAFSEWLRRQGYAVNVYDADNIKIRPEEKARAELLVREFVVASNQGRGMAS